MTDWDKPEVYIGQEEISNRIDELAKAINEQYQGEEVTVVCVLNGAFMFCSDLIRKLDLPINLDFMHLSSYGDSTQSCGEVKIKLDMQSPIEGKHVLIVEDIVDSGLTLKTLRELLAARRPQSLRLASLLYKPERNIHKVPIEYLGFEIEDKFVVGYGLDYAGLYRELPYIGVLRTNV